jgi:hypothetical protein
MLPKIGRRLIVRPLAAALPQAFRTARPLVHRPYTRPGHPVKRRSVLFVLLAAAVILAAWRVGAPSSGKAAGEPSGSVSFEEDGSSTGATESTPAVLEMSVFSRPRTESDVLPDEYSFRLHSMRECGDWQRDHDACFGNQIGDESRLLLADLGETHANLYAWPTTSGGVCTASGEGAGVCVNGFEDRAVFMGWDPDTPGVGAPLTFVGVVPDDVVAARVKVHGIDHDALVQSNGFFYELSDAADTCAPVDSVTIFYQDGSSDTIPDEMIGWGWTRPENDAQPSGQDVDGPDAEPLPPPADTNLPPRC